MIQWSGKQGAAVLSLVLLAGMLSACGGKETATGKDQPAVKEENKDPVTVTFGIRPSYMTDNEIQRYIIDPVKKKYPYITVDIVKLDDKNNSFEKLLVAGALPDINVTNSLTLQGTKLLGIQEDMTAIIKENNYDLSRFQSELLDTVKANNQTDYLVGIPYYVQFNALYYNKDIFDKFGVPYPKDGMTWYEVTELAKQMTRMDNGVQYRGLEPDSVYRPASQLSLPLIDPKSYKSIVNTDQWKTVLEMVKNVYSIPGNNKVQPFSPGVNAFVKDRTIAMLAGLNNLGNLAEVKDVWNNWDLASYPVFAERPGIGTQADMHIMLMSPSSKVKDAAFKVMTTVVSDEVQLDMSHMGKGSVLKDKKFQEEFGKDLDFLKGKNIQAVFKTKPAPAFPPTEFASEAFNQITNLMKTIMKENMDVNTAMRQYNEQMDKFIEQNRKP
ncbi:sugar ABC transporter substrate-binding protein [Paenibacillus vulneris]|uniref:ABC transporter substrate-binding protein n=1 Tax=Paenibacillus vulneris TaxID=1133364 RepID=A0ABW3UY46_9BACL|nr:ABC transporter substrate-binding protein [Paenibacillus sp. 32352]